jgi:PAS domain S-box-containing protein
MAYPTERDLVLQTLLIEGIERAEIAVSIYDDDGRYVAVNTCACQLLGYDRDEILDHDVADFTAGGIDRAVLLRPERREGVRLVQRKDGSTFAAAFVVVPTRISSLPFYLALWWAVEPDDPRAADAS